MSLPSGAVPTLHQHLRFQWEPAQGCYVLLYPEGMVKLNGSAGEIMAACDGQRSVAEVTELLSDKFPDVPDIGSDIVSFLETARDNDWLIIE